MYKIYINDHPLILVSSGEKSTFEKKGYLVVQYLGNRKRLLNYIDKLEKTKEQIVIVLHHPNVSKLFSDLRSLYKVIKASGGVIFNDEGRILLIHRLGKWDLPKGKREAGEKNKETAIREVEEETGLRCVIKSKIGNSYHTYKNRKGKRILKKTAWYNMQATSAEINLQSEEGIMDYQWIDKDEFLESQLDTYLSIIDVVSRLNQI